MIDVLRIAHLRIAHLRIAPQEGNLGVGNCEGNRISEDALRINRERRTPVKNLILYK